MEARMKMYLIFSRVYLLFYSLRKRRRGKDAGFFIRMSTG